MPFRILRMELDFAKKEDMKIFPILQQRQDPVSIDTKGRKSNPDLLQAVFSFLP